MKLVFNSGLKNSILPITWIYKLQGIPSENGQVAVILSANLWFLQLFYGFSQPRWPRMASRIDWQISQSLLWFLSATLAKWLLLLTEFPHFLKVCSRVCFPWLNCTDSMIFSWIRGILWAATSCPITGLISRASNRARSWSLPGYLRWNELLFLVETIHQQFDKVSHSNLHQLD